MEHTEVNPKPTLGATPQKIRDYVSKLVKWLPEALGCTASAEHYVIPHVARKFWFRLEYHVRRLEEVALAQGVVPKPMNKTWDDFWMKTKQSEMAEIMPDYGEHLKSIPEETPLSTVRLTFNVHPLMLSCWTCLLQDAVSQFGEKACREVFKKDEIPEFVSRILLDVQMQFGNHARFSPYYLIKECIEGGHVCLSTEPEPKRRRSP